MREVILLNEGWEFTIADKPVKNVDLPHTWNNIDGQDGGNDYYRGLGRYVKKFAKPAFDADTQDVYLEFLGVNSSATILLSGKEIASHDGGYSTFRVCITDLLQDENELVVLADNAKNDRVYPQKADFTFYGGIYRDVNMVILSKEHFEMDFYGMPGLRVTPILTKEGSARITADSFVCLLDEKEAAAYHVDYEILDSEGQKVVGNSAKLQEFSYDEPIYGACDDLAMPITDRTAKNIATYTFTIDNPHLWNGRIDPYLYTLKASLCYGTKVLDQVESRFGVRSFEVYPNKGFYLNGKPYPLHGVSRHQDFKGIGNAISKEHHKHDMELIAEMGANTVRLAHYQHDQYFYDLCDEVGMVVWAEIPYISEHMPNARANSISQMRELIWQNYNHPCIVTWGLSNEITISTKDKKDMLDNHHVLNDLCHAMDMTRVTTLACYAACNPFSRVAHLSDIFSYNLYLGWYVPGLFLNDIFFSLFHLIYPKRVLGYSEYGAEGMPNLHGEHPHRGDHTEEYQAKYHEYMIRCFARFPWLWANHVWNMFDFAADARDQGGEPGMNHKGLVTFDRKTKKDSFYLYKAYWNPDPMVHICSKRFEERKKKSILVKVYSNQPEVTLYCNGNKLETKSADRVFTFKVPLSDGANVITAKAGDLEDETTFIRKDDAKSYKLVGKTSNSANWV